MQIGNTDYKVLRLLFKAMVCLLLLLLPVLTIGCKPGKFLNRNACELLNCEVLFFIDDIFPLAGGPVGSAGGEESEGGDMEEMGH